MRYLACRGCIVGMGALLLCGGCLVAPNATAADASTLDSLATEARTFVVDFVRQMLTAFGL